VDARKYAWEILHAEIRRQASGDHDGGDLRTEAGNIGLLLQQAREEGVSEFEIIIDLAGFGATYALMARTDVSDPLGVAQEIEMAVMTESDETDDRKDSSRDFEKWAQEQHRDDPDVEEKQ
jgi:hypothetical protein